MRRFSYVLLALLACHSDRAPSPGAIVERFYATTIASRLSGAPTPEALAILAPYLSDTLQALLAAARRQHDADLARSPDEKPAFAEGDLFSSLFEGPTAVEALADTIRGDSHRVTAGMTYRGADTVVHWADVVVLVPQHGHLVIDDIEYRGSWDFATRGYPPLSPHNGTDWSMTPSGASPSIPSVSIWRSRARVVERPLDNRLTVWHRCG